MATKKRKNLKVTDNVAYNIQGMAYFFEDAVETGAHYENNLGILVRPAFSLLAVDQSPAVFWITNPDNTFIRNHAVGAGGNGFWYGQPP